MPRHNQFQHQNYPTSPSIPPVFQKVAVDDADGIDFGQLHKRLKFGNVILVPGTFRGDDPFALAALLAGSGKTDSPFRGVLDSVADGMKKATLSMTGAMIGDIANYTTEYRDLFQKLVGDDPSVEILEPMWSSQNNHQARADLAIKLLLQLNRLQPTPERMTLMWGHSHAGNGFAILSNLLANHRPSVSHFFESAGQSSEDWLEAESILQDAASPHPWAQSLCFATFGTPVRYGWDTAGYRSLVHVLFHRNQQPSDSVLTQPLYPMYSMKDIVAATFGDWIQAFAIAGTDVTPSPLKEVEERLAKVLESNLQQPVFDEDLLRIKINRLREACARWKSGTRCHNDGHHLLLDYEPSGRKTRLGLPVEHARFGHGVATTTTWLPVHLTLVMRTLVESL